MFKPGDDDAPAFDDPWQAQALAIADTLVTSGQITATDWANALGAELRAAEQAGKPDTTETYYLAVIAALETVSNSLGLDASARATRQAEWTDAYLRTPHGEPVELTRD